MYGHYRFETDPESNPLEFCPQTVEVREKVTFRDQTYHNVRVGFACLVGHVCRD